MKPTSLVRVSPECLALAETLRDRMEAIYTDDGAPGNAAFIRDASYSSLFYILFQEAQQHLPKPTATPLPRRKPK